MTRIAEDGRMKGPIAPKELRDDIRRLVSESKQEVARSVNSALVSLYWRVGERIRTEILKESRGEYGQKIVHAVSAQLSTEFGSGFSKPNLWNMVRFAEAFPDEKIVYALRRQLSWTHFRRIIYLDDPLRREFYAEMCRLERRTRRSPQNITLDSDLTNG